MAITNYNGQLNSNEIFGSIYNMIISQQTFSKNIANSFSKLVNMARVDGSMYGDTKTYYSTDILKSHPWGNDAEAANLLALDRAKDPNCQAITLDVFRQIRLTVDKYLSKRAWGTAGAFAEFNSVILAQITDTKKIYDATIYNTFIGTHETAEGSQKQTITLDAGKEAQEIAEFVANLLVDLATPGRDFNDYKNYRSFDDGDMIFVWNSEVVNKIKNIDLPTIYHKEELMKKMDNQLPAKYFGKVNASGGTTGGTNTTIYALVEKDYGENHCFPGDVLPANTKYEANETYTPDNKILFKAYYKGSVPFMSGFEVRTSFFNARSLTTNEYLTFAHNTLQHLHNYPFITVRKA